MVQRALQAKVIGRGLRIPPGERIQHAQHAARATCRCDRWFTVAATQGADAITTTLCRPCGDSTGTCGLHRFEAHAGAEVQGRRGIGHDQADPLAFGLEQFGVGTTGACGHPPVDMARIITGHVLA